MTNARRQLFFAIEVLIGPQGETQVAGEIRTDASDFLNRFGDPRWRRSERQEKDFLRKKCDEAIVGQLNQPIAGRPNVNKYSCPAVSVMVKRAREGS